MSDDENHSDGGDEDETFIISEDYDNDYDDDESYESEEDDGSGRTLLFLCEEGQLDIALKRVREWDEKFPLPGILATSETTKLTDDSAIRPASSISKAAAATASPEEAAAAATIQRELFRKNPNTGNYCFHEILAGGTSGKSAPELVERLVRRYRSQATTPSAIARYQEIFLAQPTVGSNGRTILHWCAWSKTTPQITRLVLGACPKAMCLRDNKSHFSRTPLEIAQRYWPDDEITRILKSSLQTYLPYRLRICARLCAERLFLAPSQQQVGTSKSKKDATSTSTPALKLKPFDKKDRKIAGLAPRPWFVASVLGYALQREMKGLALRILSFVGCGARLEPKKRSKKKKRKANPANTGEGSSCKAGKASDQENSKSRKKRKT